MKKLLLAITLLLTLTTQSQINKKGSVVRIDKCELLDEGGYRVISSYQPYETFATITNEKFFYRSRQTMASFKLGDGQIDVIAGDTIYNYYTSVNKELRLLAIRNCEGFILVAIFPMDGTTKFVQYLIKPRNNERVSNNKKQ